MGSSVAKGSSQISTPALLTDFLKLVRSYNVTELDTARVYARGKSEELLGATDAQTNFKISTKAPGFSPGSLTQSAILKNSELSHAALKQDKVDIYYIHGPDHATPLEEQCRAFGTLYAHGRFARFGVSNLSSAQVEQIYEICKREGYPLPTVYQGGYNPIHRTAEMDLFPTLRQLGMVFYAYSPLAGGLLAKPIEQLLNPREGTRFHEMPVFGDIYLKETNIVALKKMNAICEEAGICMMEATMRWFMHHSPLRDDDAVILGAASKEQVAETLSACGKGPLPQKVADGWEDTWKNLVESRSTLGAWPNV